MKVDFIPETEPKPAAANINQFIVRIGAHMVAILAKKLAPDTIAKTYNEMEDPPVEPERYPAEEPGYDSDEDSE